MNKNIIIIIGIIVLLIYLNQPKQEDIKAKVLYGEESKKMGPGWECSGIYAHCWENEYESIFGCAYCYAHTKLSTEIKNENWKVCPTLNAYYMPKNITINWFAYGTKQYSIQSNVKMSDFDCDLTGCHNAGPRIHEDTPGEEPLVINAPTKLNYLSLIDWDGESDSCLDDTCTAFTFTYITYDFTDNLGYILDCCQDSECQSNHCIKNGDWSTWHCEPCECNTEPCCNGCEYIEGCNPYEIFLEYKNSYLSYGGFSSFIELANGWVNS